MIYIYAILIFGGFAVVGGLGVRLILRHQSESESDLPQRGVPWESLQDKDGPR